MSKVSYSSEVQVTEIKAVQYRSRFGGGWWTVKQVMRSKDDSGTLEPMADFQRRAERERAFQAQQNPTIEWRIVP